MTTHDSFRSMEDFGSDHAGTHRSTAGQHARVSAEITAADKAAILEQGFVVMPDLFDAAQLEQLRRDAAPWLTHFGRNSLEGFKTKRVYSVAARVPSCNILAEHPRILCLLDELLLPNYLLSMYQIIEIHPGEIRQHLHHDDVFYPIPRPRPPISIASILAVDDFTERNGATVMIPGSHRWDDRRPTADDPVVPMQMSAGSVVVFLGTLWHGGGANQTDRPRLAVTCQYCEPWARTQENMILAVPPQIVAQSSENMQRMLGYSVHSPFMGNVGGMSPKRVLDR